MNNQEYLDQVGMAFKLERTRQRLTAQVVADRSGVNKMTVISIENAKDNCHLLTLKRVADGLGKPLSEFL